MERGRLARAVRADERDNLALVHLKGNPLDRMDCAIIYV